jgi:nitroimidazol reductase NimA-like FMN-containing flavoprotein (pyridoxamine 5'-phosphate oxidase superfamily)
VETNDRAASVLTPVECFELLAGVEVGRIGVSIDALPAILPVHFALSGRSVVFRTVPGSQLDGATHGAVVAFQADDLSVGSRRWSVLIQGLATEISDPGDLAGASAAPLGGWNRPAGDLRWLGIQPGTVSGRVFG